MPTYKTTKKFNTYLKESKGVTASEALDSTSGKDKKQTRLDRAIEASKYASSTTNAIRNAGGQSVDQINQSTQARRERAAQQQIAQGSKAYANPIITPAVSDQEYNNRALALQMMTDRMKIGQQTVQDMIDNDNAKNFIDQTYNTMFQNKPALYELNKRNEEIRKSALDAERSEQKKNKQGDSAAFDPTKINLPYNETSNTFDVKKMPISRNENNSEMIQTKNGLFNPNTVWNKTAATDPSFTPTKTQAILTPNESALKERRAQQYANQQEQYGTINEEKRQAIKAERDKVKSELENIKTLAMLEPSEEYSNQMYTLQRKYDELDNIYKRMATNNPGVSLSESIFGDVQMQQDLENNPYAADVALAMEQSSQGLIDYYNERLQDRNSTWLNDAFDSIVASLQSGTYNAASGIDRLLTEDIENFRGTDYESIANRREEKRLNFGRTREENELRDQLLYKIGSDSRNKSGTLRGDIMEVAQSLGLNLPGYVASAALGPHVGSIVLGIQMAGQSYKEMRDAGASRRQAKAIALEQGIEEWATDEIIGIAGGAMGKGLVQNSTLYKTAKQAVMRGGKTPIGKLAVNVLSTMFENGLGEFAQEFLQYYTENATKEIVLNQKYFEEGLASGKDFQNAAHAGWIGFLNAIIMGASSGSPRLASYVVNTIRTGKQSDVNASMTKMVRESIDMDQSHYADYESFLKAQNLYDVLESAERTYAQGYDLTAFDKGSIENAMNELSLLPDGNLDESGTPIYAYSAGGYDKNGNPLEEVIETEETTDDQLKAQQFNNLVNVLTEGGDTNAVDVSMLNENEQSQALTAAMNQKSVKIAQQKAAQSIASDLAATFDEQGKNAFLAQAEGAKTEQNVIDQFKSFAALYRAGSAATEETLIKARAVMTAEQISAAQKAGSVDFNRMFPGAAEYRSKIKNVKVQNVTPGNVDFVDVDENSLSDGQKLRVDFLSAFYRKAMGMDVRFTQSKTDENGQYIGKNGSYQTINGRPTITFDVNAMMTYQSDWTGNLEDFAPILSTMAHETAHWAESKAPNEYKKYAQGMVAALAQSESYLKGGRTFDEIVELQRKHMNDVLPKKSDGTEYTKQDAIQEMVARGTEEMFKGSQAFKDAIASMDEQTQKTIFEHIKDFFKSVAEFLDKMLGIYSSNSPEAEAIRALKAKNEEAFNKLQQMFDEMFESAADNTKAGYMPAYEVTGQEQNSIRQLGEALGLDVQIGDNGNILAIVDKNGKYVKKVTEGMVQRTPMGSLIQTAMSEGHIDQTTAVKQYKMFSDLMNMSLKYGETDLVWETASQFMFSSIKSNADKQYVTTVDYGTICAKTQALIDVLSDTMVQKGRGLTRQEVIDAYNATAGIKLSVPCPVCYVFSRWMGVPSLLGSMVRFQEAYSNYTQKDIDKYVASLKKQYAAEIEAKKSASDKPMADIEALNKVVDDKKGKLQDQVEKLSEQLRIARGNKNNSGEINKLAKETQKIQNQFDDLEAFKWVSTVFCKTEGENVTIDPKYHPVDKNVLLDLRRTGEFASNPMWAKSWTYRTTRGAGMGKSILPYSGASIGDLINGLSGRYAKKDNPFIQLHNAIAENDKKAIAKWEKKAKDAIATASVRAKKQNLIGGQRFQSTSDFRAEWGLDYMMTFLECQAVGSKVQLYTKVIEAVDFFASVGAEVNLSIMPKDKGYVIENGKVKLVFSDVTGINFDAAYKKTKQYNNAQMILVGINDTHIRTAMADDRITFIIPWHASGNSKDTLGQLMAAVDENLEEGQDYSKTQEDKVINANIKADVRKLRLDIIMGNAEKLSKPQQSILNKNAFLKDLYRRFYQDKTADEYHNFLAKKQAEQIFPYEYWDTTLTIKDADKNGERFKQYCESLGIKPRFSGDKNGNHDFSNDKGYWKLLIDRKMYNNDGTYHNPKAIDITGTKVKALPQAVNSNNYKDQDKIAQAVSDTLNTINRREYDNKAITDTPRNSMRDAEYLTALSNNDEEMARRIIDEAAKAAGYDVTTPVYHGSPEKEIKVFRSINFEENGANKIKGYFSNSYNYASTYGNNVNKYYLKMDNPLLLDPTMSDDYTDPSQAVQDMLEQLKRAGVTDIRLNDFMNNEEDLAEWLEVTVGQLDPWMVVNSDGGNLTERIQAAGYDGIEWMEGYDEDMHYDPVAYMPFNESAIKRADTVTYDDKGQVIVPSRRFDAKNSDVRYSTRDDYAPVFYSNLQRQIEAYKGDKLGANSVESFLRGKGVKEEEIKWSGIRTFLEGKKSVTKAELLDFLKANQLQVQEVTRDNRKVPATPEQQERIVLADASIKRTANELKAYIKKVMPDYEFAREDLENQSMGSLIRHIDDYADRKKVQTDVGKRYQDQVSKAYLIIQSEDDFGYDTTMQALSAFRQEPDAFDLSTLTKADRDELVKFTEYYEEYKNLQVVPLDQLRKIRDLADKISDYQNTIDRVTRDISNNSVPYRTNWSDFTVPGAKNYREYVYYMPGSDYSNAAMSAHWNDKGVLAHARVDDFEAPDDKKVMFVEEIQSDWHNEGASKDTVYESENKPIKNAFVNKMDAVIKEFESTEAYQSIKQKAIDAGYEGLALDMLSETTLESRSNIDYLSEKLGLSNDEITIVNQFASKYQEYLKLWDEAPLYSVPDAPYAKTYTDFVLKNLLRKAAEGGYDYLAWTTGKMQEERWSDEFAEGYRIEYDQDIPKFLNKYGKQWGARVGETKIYGGWDAEGNGAIVPAIPITESMKQSVLYEGQPQFQERIVEDNINDLVSINAIASKMGDLINQRYFAPLSRDGSLIMEVGNDLVFVGGKYDNPIVNTVVNVKVDGRNLNANERYIVYDTITEMDGKEYEDVRKYRRSEYWETVERACGLYLGQSVSITVFDRRRHAAISNPQFGRKIPVLPTTDIDTQEKNVSRGNSSANEQLRDQDRESGSPDFYDKLIEKYGALPKGEKAVTDFVAPAKTDNGSVSRFARTAGESGWLDEGMQDALKEEILNDAMTYQVATDAAAENYAKHVIESYGESEAQKRWDAVVNGTNALTKDDVALGEMLLTKYAEAGDTASAMKMVAELAAEGTRAGQTIQAMRLLKKWADATPAVGAYYIEKTVEKMNKDYEKMYKGKKEIPKLVIDQTLMDEYLNAQTEESREAAQGKIYQNLADQMPNTVADKVRAWRYLSMLMNPRTIIRNVVGNAVFIPAVKTKNLIKTGLETATNVDERTTGLRKDRKYVDFAIQDFEEVADIITGESRTDARGKIHELHKVWNDGTKVGHALNKTRDANAWLLDNKIFGDAAFLKIHYVDAFARYLTANKTDLNNTTAVERARQYAIKEAQKATYRDASAAATKINQLSRTSKAAEYIVEGILPFKKTPINILRRGVEYSPFGLIKSLTYGIKQLNDGKITQNEFFDGIAAGTTGTGLMLIGLALGMMGAVRGSLGDDKDKKNLKKLEGEQAYSIKIGNTTYTIDWAAPSSLPFFIGAEVAGALRSEGATNLNEILDAAQTITEPMFNLSMLSGLNDVLSAVSNSNNKLTSFVAESITSYLGQFVPTVLGQVARTVDTTRRDVYVDKNLGAPSSALYFLEKMQNKIPGWSFLNNPYYDQWGRTDTSSTLMAAFENFISPGYVSNLDYSKVNTEVERVNDLKTIDKKVIPQTMPKYFTVDGETRHLTSDEWSTWQRITGQASYNILNNMFSDKRYLAMTDDQKAQAIAYAYEYAKYVGRREIDPGYEPDSWILNIYDAYQNGGVEAYDSILTKAQSKIIDDKAVGETDPETGRTINGSVKLDKMRQILDGTGTAAEKGKIYESMFPDDELYQEWKSKKYSSADYIQYSLKLQEYKKSTNKKGENPSQEDVASWIKKQTKEKDKRMLLWQMAGYKLDSTKDGKIEKNGNYKKYMN